MEIDQKMSLMNKLSTALAKEENITPVQALAMIKKEFMDRDETTETLKRAGKEGQIAVAPEDAYLYASEQTKVELKRLELQQRQIDNEQKRIDAESKKQEFLEKKLEMEEKRHQDELKYQREKDAAELKYQREKDAAELNYKQERDREDARIREQTAATERQLFISNLSGKKDPDEMLEFLKLQSQNTSEYYKAQGESQKGLYETLLQTKNQERDKEYEWKKELARIEADREVELAKLRQEDPKAANSTEILVDFLAEKFENLGRQLSTNPTNDFLAQIDQHNKFQEGLIKAAMPIFKAQGLSEDQLEKIKNQVGMEEKRQEGTLDKLWGMFGPKIKQYIGAVTEKTTKELDAAPSGFENRIDPEIERRIRAETEAKARQMEEENSLLQQELEVEKKRIQTLQEERRGLEYRAHNLGIQFDDAATNDQLFYAIEQQEAINEQYKQNQEKQIQERQREQQAAQPEPEPEPEPPEPQPQSDTHLTYTIGEPHDQQAVQQLAEETFEEIAHPINIEKELAIPREISPETQEFIKSVGAEQEQAGADQEAKPKKQRKARATTKKDKARSIYKVSDGINSIEVDALNHKGAALSATNQFVGTEEQPVRLTVTNGKGEERQYDTFNEERQSTKGKKFMAPRLKAVV